MSCWQTINHIFFYLCLLNSSYMIETKQNFNLTSFNTFGFNVNARAYLACKNINEIKEALSQVNEKQEPYLILGGGSNILFKDDFNGTIVHPLINNISVINETQEHIWLEVEAGVEWDELVEYTVNNNWYGLENLSYIPGSVGASPVQNIGAYGVEVKDCIEKVKGFYIENQTSFEFDNEHCLFDYRQSIFKTELKNKTIITSVIFKLNKTEQYNLTYGPIKEQLNNKELSLNTVRQVIIDIRKSKLPEPDEIGNAGSFFKNPVICAKDFNCLKEQYPTIPGYVINEEQVKVPAGWLIEQAGWKGQSIGDAAVHSKQALVLINKGKATGQQILDLAKAIIDSIYKKYNIAIEPEVNVI